MVPSFIVFLPFTLILETMFYLRVGKMQWMWAFPDRSKSCSNLHSYTEKGGKLMCVFVCLFVCLFTDLFVLNADSSRAEDSWGCVSCKDCDVSVGCISALYERAGGRFLVQFPPKLTPSTLLL